MVNRLCLACALSAVILLVVVLVTPSAFSPSTTSQAVGVTGASRGGDSARRRSFTNDIFYDLLCSGIGETVCRAVYDSRVLPAVVLSFDDEGNSSLLGPLIENWVAWDAGLIPKRKKEKPNPATLSRWVTQNTTAHQLLLLRSTTAIAIGRIHRDAALVDDIESASLFEQQIIFAQLRRALHAVVSEFFIALQLIVDTMEADLKKSLRHHPSSGGDLDGDPLLQILGSLKVTDTPGEVERRIREFKTTSKTGKRKYSSATNVYFLDYHRPELDHVFPASGRFWITFRSTTGCHSLVRSCEDPEACRFVCNPRYLRSMAQKPSTNADRGLRFVGLGSNNEWGWEQSTLRMFTPGEGDVLADQLTRPVVTSITTLDCTVKQWKYPEDLARQPVHFQAARTCIGQVRGPNVIRMDDLKALVLLGEGGPESAGQSLPHLSPVSWAERQAGPMQRKGKLPPKLDRVRQKLDAVSLLKIDVESHEHSAIPIWAKLELRDLKRSLRDALTRELASDETMARAPTMIDFEKDVESFFTVSMLQMELHEYRGVPMEPWLLQGMRLKQYLSSLGFIQVTQEPNFFHDCCFELLFVHYRFFVRSEAWHAVEVSV